MKKYLKLIGNFLAILSIVFVIYSLFQMDIKVEKINNWYSFALLLLVGSAISVATVVLLGIAWTRNIQFFSEEKVDYRRAVKVYAKANLGKYIPGNVMHYIERNVFAAEIGLNRLETAISSGLEVIGLILAAALMSVIFSFKNIVLVFRQLITVRYLIVISALLLAMIVVLIVVWTRSKRLKKIFSKIKDKRFLNVLAGNLFVYLLVFLLLGLLMVMIVQGVSPLELDFDVIRTILSAYTLAWVTGFIVPGAPGGIGVREFVISIITVKTGLKSVILFAAIIHRVLTVIGDIIAYVVSNINIKKRKNKEIQ